MFLQAITTTTIVEEETLMVVLVDLREEDPSQLEFEVSINKSHHLHEALPPQGQCLHLITQQDLCVIYVENWDILLYNAGTDSTMLTNMKIFPVLLQL